MLNISSIKELLHKPSEIQWNITGTLPEKLKEKFIGFYPTIYYTMKPQKHEKMLFLGAWEPMWNPMVFYDFVNFWTFQPLSFGYKQF